MSQNQLPIKGINHMAPIQSLSVVIPVFNEQGNLHALYAELNNVLVSIQKPYEIIFIDDGSTDESFRELSELHSVDNNVTVIQFRRNFGQTAAFAAGFDAAQGDAIVTLDADGQNDPNDIPILLSKMEEGDYDLVNGWRIHRKEPFVRQILSKAANIIISRSSQIVIHDRGCSLKIFKREVIKNIKLYGQLHRFLPELASAIGISMAEVPVNDRKRREGRSKYGTISRTPRVILDLITVLYLLTFLTSPMRLFGSMALICSLTGAFIAGVMALTKIYYGIISGWAGFRGYEIGNRPLLLLSILLIVIGVQLLMMGLLGEMIMRVYYETREKPVYHIRQTLSSEKVMNDSYPAQKFHDNLYPIHHQKDVHTAE